MYELLLLIGGIGFLAMAAMGMIHTGGGGHGHGGAHGHAGLGHGHAHALGQTHALGHGHGHAGHGGQLARVGQSLKGRSGTLLTLLSPLDLFALAMGAGAAGVLLKGILAPSLLVWAAVAGALAMDFLILKPIIGLAMKFVTNPSEGIEGTVKVTAQAITRFDAQGKGLVKLTLDGQIVQLLAALDPAELELGEGVGKGDEVTVIEVDAKHNSCTVSKLNATRNP